MMNDTDCEGTNGYHGNLIFNPQVYGFNAINSILNKIIARYLMFGFISLQKNLSINY